MTQPWGLTYRIAWTAKDDEEDPKITGLTLTLTVEAPNRYEALSYAERALSDVLGDVGARSVHSLTLVKLDGIPVSNV